MIHDYDYVSKYDSEVKDIYNTIIKILNEVQDIVRSYFTFSFTPVGSYSRNMITYDKKSNVGFDFDFNIEINDDDEEYTPDRIKLVMLDAFSKVVPKYGYSHVENSTRVITIKKTNRFLSSIEHSCDFAIVYNYLENGKSAQQYIHFIKGKNEYRWYMQSKGYYMLTEKIEWLKKNNLWDDLRKHYIYKKNNNGDSEIHSRTIFAIAVQEICQKNGYYN